MNKRERILIFVVGGCACLFLGYFGLQFWMVKPLKEIDRQTTTLRAKLRQINDERREYFTSEDFIKRAAQTTFGPNTDIATAQAGKMFTELLLRLGLPEAEFTRTPVGPRRLRGAQEVGLSIQGDGPHSKIIDLVFELQQCPQIHRVENVVISSGDKPGRIKARFRFLTLVIDSAPEVPPIELKPKHTLASPERRMYNAIVQRDLLRPYVKRAEGSAPTVAANSGVPGAVRPETLKVVSLTDWQGEPEVHVMNLASMKLSRFKPGDSLNEGQIVMVDYRARPMPGKPDLVSYSRVILKIETNYWAVEHGHTLAEKYQLPADALPSGVPKL